MCGLPGAGKTTVARRLERERPALRLTADDWMLVLFGPDLEGDAARGAPDLRRAAVEALQWQVAERALELGLDVVIDWGLWSRSQRDGLRARAQALGARAELVFLDVPLDELWQRVSARNDAQPPGAYRIERASLERWSGWFEAPGEDETTPDGVAIERARPGDLPELEAVERAASALFSTRGFSTGLPQEVSSLEELAPAQAAGRLFVARTRAGEIVGFAHVELVGDGAHLEEVDVLPSFGQRGIGRRLVEAAKDWARAAGHARLTLTTFREVPWNAPFYTRCGFRELAPAELGTALREVVDDESARGLDPALRVVMACDLKEMEPR